MQTTGNLGLLDYWARMYDPAIGRWTAQDPLSEKYYSFSAYNYCVNNPVMFVDPDGRSAGIYYNGLGQVVGMMELMMIKYILLIITDALILKINLVL